MSHRQSLANRARSFSPTTLSPHMREPNHPTHPAQGRPRGRRHVVSRALAVHADLGSAAPRFALYRARCRARARSSRQLYRCCSKARCLRRQGRTAARAEVVVNVDQAIAGLPPEARRQIDQLFALLAFAPSRCLIAGVWSPWPEASTESIAAFLARWRDSRFLLLRSAYGALHQLVMAAWYGSPRAWPAIGYPGPPSLEIG